jgi:cytoskeletal protein CcmA (bactofilin family)
MMNIPTRMEPSRSYRWAWLGLGIVVAVGVAYAQDNAAQREFGGDRFVAAGAPTVSEPVKGDLFIAGGSIDVDAPVSGDVVAAGGRVRVDEEVAQSVYAAGGQLTLNGGVGRNVRLAGGRIEVGPQARISGNLTVIGGQLRLRGRVDGHVQAGAGRVLIDAPVTGDVAVTAGRVELGPRARIGGKLSVRSREELKQAPEAQVLGGIEQQPLPLRRERGGERLGPHGERIVSAGGWVWTVGLMLLAVVLVAMLPRFFGGVAQVLRERPAWAAGIGFIVLICMPAAALVLLMTIVGAPLALVLVPLYFVLLLIGYVSAGIALGDWVLARWSATPGTAAAPKGKRALAVALAVLAVALAARVPWIGGWIAFAALLLGLGALAMHLRTIAVQH